MTTNERGESVTCVVCVSAAGWYVPPMLIYKRKRMKAEMTNGAPPGTVFSSQEKGWMSNEGFLEWLKHFIYVVKPSKEAKVVLLLDGHVTHAKNLAAIELARESGVRMISLPPHTTHRLQSLDVSFFGPLGTYYDEAMRTWIRTHISRSVTTWQVAELFGEAYGRTASVGLAVKGFQASGLWPLNMNVFTDADFTASAFTDVCSEDNVAGANQSTDSSTDGVSTQSDVTGHLPLSVIPTCSGAVVSSTNHRVNTASSTVQLSSSSAVVSDLSMHATSSVTQVTSIPTPRCFSPIATQSDTETTPLSATAEQPPPEVSVPTDSFISVGMPRSVECPPDTDPSVSRVVSPTVVTTSTVSQQAAISGPRVNLMTPPTSTSSFTVVASASRVPVSSVSPLPVIAIEEKNRKRKSRTTQAADLTSTPYKKALESTPAYRKRSAARKLVTAPDLAPDRIKKSVKLNHSEFSLMFAELQCMNIPCI